MTGSSVLVITATYNEAKNIEKLVKQVLSLRNDIDMLVVDDNSPDKTSAVVSGLIGQPEFKKRLHLISRPSKLGYGTAFIEGFSFGLENNNYRYFVSMDADFSHDPSYIKIMLDEIQNADLVIGSRYIKGGATRCWGLHRRILSKTANIYSRLILGMNVKDCTSGFRCYKREVIELIELTKISSTGYSFLEELLFYCKLKNFSMREIPIVFTDRKFGKSKICRKEIYKAILKVPLLRITGFLRGK